MVQVGWVGQVVYLPTRPEAVLVGWVRGMEQVGTIWEQLALRDRGGMVNKVRPRVQRGLQVVMGRCRRKKVRETSVQTSLRKVGGRLPLPGELAGEKRLLD
jgi:hypothetical protein